MTSVLYDVPGPRAVARNRILGVVTFVIVAALIGVIVWRLAVTGQFTAEKWQAFTYTNVWIQIAIHTWNTIAAFLVAAIGALILGFALAIGRLSDHVWVRAPITAIVEVLRAVPVLIFMMLLYYALPVLGIRMPTYWAVVIALIAYNGSVLSEIIRAGVQSLPRGQYEAGYAVGLRKSGVMRYILMPQAIRAMLPAIIAQLVVTLKDTALGFIITYPELLRFARLLGGDTTLGSPVIPSMMVVAAIYIGLCLILSYVASVVEKQMRRSAKVIAVAPADAQDVTDTELIVAQRGPVTRDGSAADGDGGGDGGGGGGNS
jgi:amine acid ABC transporter, permease protein, 3-TM region, His/Glu/Gln/Arg/opine family